MELINLTPHTITLVDGENRPVLDIAPSGQPARAQAVRKRIGEVVVSNYRIPVTTIAMGR